MRRCRALVWITLAAALLFWPAIAPARADSFSEMFPSARALHLEGKYVASIDVLRRILRDDLAQADRIATLDLMARCEASAGQHKQARATFVKILLIDDQYEFDQDEPLARRDYHEARGRFQDRYGAKGTARRCMATSHLGLVFGLGSAQFRDNDLAQLTADRALLGGTVGLSRSLVWTIGGTYEYPVARRFSLEAMLLWRHTGGGATTTVPSQSPYTEHIIIDYLDCSAAVRYPLVAYRQVGLDLAAGAALQTSLATRGRVVTQDDEVSGTVSDYTRPVSVRPLVGIGLLLADAVDGGLRFEFTYSPETFGRAFSDSRVLGDLDLSEIVGRVVVLF